MRGREGKGGGGLRKDWSWPHTCTYILGLLTAFATILIDCAHMMGANQAHAGVPGTMAVQDSSYFYWACSGSRGINFTLHNEGKCNLSESRIVQEAIQHIVCS